MNSPATVASAMASPSSTVLSTVSGSRLAVSFKAGPGVLEARCRNLHLHTPQGPSTFASARAQRNPATHSEFGRARLNHAEIASCL